eukprot:284447-Chlamydomonas_euryale.AAC.1
MGGCVHADGRAGECGRAGGRMWAGRQAQVASENRPPQKVETASNVCVHAACVCAQLRRLIDGIDLNGNHSVDFSEFVAATMRDLAEGLSERDKADHLMAAFVRFDVDGSG